jgi:hypothetical protein
VSDSIGEWVDEQVRAGVGALYWAEDTDPTDGAEADFDLADVAKALTHAEHVASAARAVAGRLKLELKARIVESGHKAMGVGGHSVYRVTPTVKYRVNDPAKLVRWLHEDGGLEAVARVFRLSGENLRISQLRAEVEARLDTDLDTFLDTFDIEVDRSEPVLSLVPLVKAPKFLQSIEDGELK